MLADASARIHGKNDEIRSLQLLLRSKDEEMERLRRSLEELSRQPKHFINLEDSDQWKIRFNELQNRHRRDVDNYEGELLRKDQVRFADDRSSWSCETASTLCYRRGAFP